MENILELINKNKFDEIIKIKNYNEYKLNENNILHLLAIRGNQEGIDFLIDNKFDYNLANDEGNNIIHLLFEYGWDNIASVFYNKYPKLLEKFNKHLELPIKYCIKRYNTFIECFNFMKKNKSDIYNLFNYISYYNDNIIIEIIDNLQEENYIEFLKTNIDILDFTKPKRSPILIYSIQNNHNDLATFFIGKNKGLDIKNNMFLLPINVACGKNNIQIVELILKHNPDITYGGLDNEYLPINIAINNDYIDLLNILIKYIKNYNLIDKYKNTYLHYLSDKLNDYVSTNNIAYEKKIRTIIIDFIKNSDIDLMNLDGLSSRTILQNYFKLKKNKDIEFIKKELKKIKNTTKNDKEYKDFDFNIFKQKHYNTGLFNSDVLHNMLYCIYIKNKYNIIDIPFIKFKQSSYNNSLDELKMQNINYSPHYKIIYDILGFGRTYLYPLMPSLILWHNRHLYYIDNNLYDYIKNPVKRFLFIKITLIIGEKFTHANCVLIDYKDYSVRRFEPYGINDVNDEYYLDKLLSDKISDILKKKIRYYRPGDYLEHAKFQSVSNDSITLYKKNGDPMGYCLAWCFWYVELKLNNPDINEEDLIKNAIINIYKYYKNTENPYIYFIRDYARKLNDEKDKILKKIGLDKNELYDIEYKVDNLKKVLDYIVTIFV
jgi:hypothetical protein